MNDIIFSPTRRIDLTQRHLEKRRANKGDGIPMYLRGVDMAQGGKFVAGQRGEMTSIIARPANGKTGYMIRWAREHAKHLRLNPKNGSIVVYITRESAVENLQTFLLAAEARDQERISKSTTEIVLGDITDDEWNELMQINADSMASPLWIIGHSLQREAGRPPLTIDNIVQALKEIEVWGNEKKSQYIDIIFLDYLQKFPVPPNMDMRAAMIQYMDAFKDMSIEFNCHVVVGVQARRDVETRKYPIPLLNDGMESSNIEQASQNVFSLVRPRMYFQEGDTFGDKDPVKVANNQLLLTCLKQTNGEPNWSKWLRFEPEFNRLDLLELKQYKFSQKDLNNDQLYPPD